MHVKETRLKKRLQAEEQMLRRYLRMLEGRKAKPKKRFKVVRGKAPAKAPV